MSGVLEQLSNVDEKESSKLGTKVHTQQINSSVLKNLIVKVFYLYYSILYKSD